MWRRPFDWTISSIALVLAIVSVATIYTITYVGVGNTLALNQLIYFVIGFGLFGFFSFFDYRQLKEWAMPIFGLGLVILIPMIPIWSHNVPFVICEFNSCRWLDLGFFRFQTSELFKVIIVILFAGLLADRVGREPWWRLFIYLLLLVVPGFLISQQPDLGTSIVVVLSGLVVLLAARFPIWIWIGFLVLGIIAAPIAWQNLKPYQKNRVEIFLNPELDPSKTGYNIRQAEIAVGSGGLWGRGFGQGSQSQLNFLPVAHTDFIFAGYAEATGFVGAIFLILLYAVLIIRATLAASLAKDMFGRLLALGIAGQIGVQVLINIGMNIRLMPVTGVPLPLMSFGGTSVFVTLISLGLIESIIIRHKRLSFS